jgi:hypothetical protein
MWSLEKVRLANETLPRCEKHSYNAQQRAINFRIGISISVSLTLRL